MKVLINIVMICFGISSLYFYSCQEQPLSLPDWSVLDLKGRFSKMVHVHDHSSLNGHLLLFCEDTSSHSDNVELACSVISQGLVGASAKKNSVFKNINKVLVSLFRDIHDKKKGLDFTALIGVQQGKSILLVTLGAWKQIKKKKTGEEYLNNRIDCKLDKKTANELIKKYTCNADRCALCSIKSVCFASNKSGLGVKLHAISGGETDLRRYRS